MMQEHFICRIYWVTGLQIINSVIEILSGSLRGYGFSLPPALVVLIAICGVRILWVKTAFTAVPTFPVLLACCSAGWLRPCCSPWSIAACGGRFSYVMKKGCVKIDEKTDFFSRPPGSCGHAVFKRACCLCRFAAAADGRLSKPKAMAVKDHYLFVCDLADLKIYDLHDRLAAPQIVHFPENGDKIVNCCALDGNTLYITMTDPGRYRL